MNGDIETSFIKLPIVEGKNSTFIPTTPKQEEKDRYTSPVDASSAPKHISSENRNLRQRMILFEGNR